MLRTDSELQASEPLKLLILPEGTSPNARICTLAHPRSTKPSRYYFCPVKGIFEFTRVAAPKSSHHSWLLSSQLKNENNSSNPSAGKPSKSDHCSYEHLEKHALTDVDGGAHDDRPVSKGYIIKSPELLIATPIDPLFLLLPSLHSKKLFLSADDIFDDLCENSKHFKYVSSNKQERDLLEKRMISVCDIVKASDEKMHRLSTQKLLEELLDKAKTMVATGLPSTMEERFISKALEMPVMGLKREQSSLSDTAGGSQNEATAHTPLPSDIADSQSSTSTIESAVSDSSHTTITIPDSNHTPTATDDIKHLFRIRTALSYIISAYIPVPLAATLNGHLSSVEGSTDFKPLDEYLRHISKLRAEVLASRSLSDFSRKRGMNEDDEAAETRAEKKRKKEEEEKKKKLGETRGLRDLKKVDTSGMKKMSDFFGKGAVTKKK